MNPIYVTKPVLPDKEIFDKYVKEIWDRNYLTNNGPLLYEFEKQLCEYFNVENVVVVSNGTIALQMAIKALELKEDIITTPFSFVATTSAIVWENCNPVFCDIESNNFNIDSCNIESRITAKTSAILPTHVFGYPCNIEEIDFIAKKNKLKVIYDAAHCFGSNYNGKSLVSFGDISTISFHSTKLFHTIEGGAILTNDSNVAKRIIEMRNFGYQVNNTYTINQLGTNAKLSEIHAAMGLSLLPLVKSIITKRRKIHDKYVTKLSELPIQIPKIPNLSQHNYHYFPIVFQSQKQLLVSKNSLERNGIFPRRYFYPALNTLPFVTYTKMPKAERIANLTLCLPIYYDLEVNELEKIITTLKNSFK